MTTQVTQKIGKNIVMCLTTGRSGTNLLEKLLALADETCAVHEPEPAFQHVLDDVRRDPLAAIAFVRDRKLPNILARPGSHYAETSHLFGKGFFEAFVALSIPFRLVILNREPRQVAKSLWRLKTVPVRTMRGRGFLLDPSQEGVLKLPDWEKMSDYQLCYWYCLEIERRKSVYTAECRERGIPVVEIAMERLKDWNCFQKFCGELGLCLPTEAAARHAEITAKKVNRKARYLPRLILVPLARQERKVWKALGNDGVVLRSAIQARYGGAAEELSW